MTLALRANQFWMETIEPIDLTVIAPENVLKKDASYLILGGLDGVGYAFAKTIAEHVQGNLILSSADENFLGNSDIAQKIKTLEDMGSTVFSLFLDPNELMPEMNRVSAFTGRIDGIINSYDMSALKPMGLIQDVNQLSVTEYLTDQQSALEQLRNFVDASKPSFCIMMSSLTSKIGGIGQCVTAMAGNLINRFVQIQNVNSATPWTVLNWDRWEENGNPQLSGFTPEEGSTAFQKALGLLKLETIIIASNHPQFRMESAALKALGAVQENDNEENLYDRPDIDVEFKKPVSPNEFALAKLWQHCLKINEIGVKDNFFDLGGHSLLAAQLIREIKQHFGINLDLGMFFSAPTISELAIVIEEQLSATQAQSMEAELSKIENMTEEEIEALLAGNHSPEELLNLLGKVN
jgi:acyl carrier protein